MPPFRPILRSIAFVLWIPVMLPFVYAGYLFNFRRINRFFLKLWFSVSFFILGGRVTHHSHGVPLTSGMIVSNHTSYLDVFALATLFMPRFTPKSDVAGWPIIGFLCKIARCFFIERRAAGLQENQQQLAQSLAQQETISLFAEGTTSLGEYVLPFKGGLLEIATHSAAPDLMIYPMLVLYTHLNGARLTPITRHQLAWIGEGDGDLLQHFWGVVSQKNFTVEIHTLPPVPADARSDRKTLANYCQQAIQQCMDERFAELHLERSPAPVGENA